MVDVGRPRAPVDPDLEPRCLLASTGSCRSGDAPAGSRTDTLATCPPRSIPTARSAGQRSVGGILHPTLLSLHPGVGYRASVLIACNVAWRARCVAALHRGGALSFDWLEKYSRCVVARARLGLACRRQHSPRCTPTTRCVAWPAPRAQRSVGATRPRKYGAHWPRTGSRQLVPRDRSPRLIMYARTRSRRRPRPSWLGCMLSSRVL